MFCRNRTSTGAAVNGSRGENGCPPDDHTRTLPSLCPVAASISSADTSTS